MAQDSTQPTIERTSAADRPAYVPPRIQVMTEHEILSTFQITQSMANWWMTVMC